MMTVKDTLLREIEATPEALLSETLNFLRFLKMQRDSATGPILTPDERLTLSRAAKGRFAHLSNTSDSFSQRKQEEIDWEDRHL